MRYIRRFFLISGFWMALIPPAGAQDVTIRRVTDHVMTLSMSNLGMHTNVTVIETQEGLVAVETEITPYIMDKIKEAAEKKLGRDDWAYVINTHGHLHHAGGNSVFKAVQFVGHERMRMDWLRDRLSTDAGRRQYCRDVGTGAAIGQLRRALARARLTAAQREELRRRLRFCQAVQQEIMAGFEVVNPTLTFSDRHTLDLGDVHLRLTYWGDGVNHSSIFVHVVEDRLLVGMGMAGDWMPDFYGRPSLDGIRRAISLWKELSDEDLPIDRMVGVHTPEPITSREQFRQRQHYVEALLKDLTEAQQQGLNLEQVKEKLSLDKRYAYAPQYFAMPEDLGARHQRNIDTIWALLQAETSSHSQN
ncbi:MAG: MBL fold metallo-hydrolase [Phycisphaerales bacterium]|nr:MAG: MBL fold metallo-hydrolase [Phycisphaerales bacterium]